jgi:hypothetical protein
VREPDNRYDHDAIRIDRGTPDCTTSFQRRFPRVLFGSQAAPPTSRRSARCWKSWCRNVRRMPKPVHLQQGDRQDDD